MPRPPLHTALLKQQNDKPLVTPKSHNHFGSVATKKNAESQQFKERERYAMEQYYYKWKFPPNNGMNNNRVPSNVSWINENT